MSNDHIYLDTADFRPELLNAVYAALGEVGSSERKAPEEVLLERLRRSEALKGFLPQGLAEANLILLEALRQLRDNDRITITRVVNVIRF